MAEVFFPLFIDTGGAPTYDTNYGVNVIPDFVRSQVHTFISEIVSSIWTHSLTDGSWLATNTTAAMLGISGNNRIIAYAACLGPDGNLYFVTQTGTAYTGYNTLKISKVDPDTMLEVAATALTVAGLWSSNVWNFRISPFTANGVAHIGVNVDRYNETHSTATDSYFEVFRCSDLVSVDFIIYPSSAGNTSIVAGEAPSSTSRRVYRVLGTSYTSLIIKAFVFDTGSGLSEVSVASILSTDINAGIANLWPGQNTMFDPADNNLIVAIEDNGRNFSTEPAWLLKINTTSGALVWQVPITHQASSDWVAAPFSNLTGGTLIYPCANYYFPAVANGTYLTIDLTDGSYTETVSPHFEDDNEAAALWDNANNRLFYYSSGTQDWRDGPPAWYFGMVVFGLDIPEEVCPPFDFPIEEVPCVTRWCQCWSIERTDGEVFRFTSLDRDFTFDGNVYRTCASLTASASMNTSEPSGVSNTELVGILRSTDINEADLYGGLFDDAYCEVWLVPWEGTEEPRRLAAGWAGQIKFSQLGYTMEVLGPGSRLEQTSLLEVYSPKCRYVFGDSRCTFNVEALKITGTVASATNRGLITAVLSLGSDGGSTFDGGKLRWTSGPNNGRVCEVKTVDFGTGEIVLWALTSFIATNGDTFDLLPGCAQDAAACKAYGNYINFGGFPDVPGTDAIMETPNAKN